jgi:hypothetical protein
MILEVFSEFFVLQYCDHSRHHIRYVFLSQVVLASLSDCELLQLHDVQDNVAVFVVVSVLSAPPKVINRLNTIATKHRSLHF